MTAFGLELRRDRSLIVWLGVVLLGYGAVMAAMFPILEENSRLIEEYMDVFPKEFMAAFGMTGSLADPGIFFTTYFGSWLWPIVAGIAGALVGTRAVAADLDRGFLDLPLATPIGRTRYLLASIAGQVLVMAVLAVACIAGLLVVGALVGVEFDPIGFGLAAVVAFAFGCAIAAVTTLLAVVTLSRGAAGGIVMGVLIAMYLGHVLIALSPDWEWLRPFTAFTYFDTTAIIDERELPVGDVAVFGGVALAAWAAALALFRRRDLAA